MEILFIYLSIAFSKWTTEDMCTLLWMLFLLLLCNPPYLVPIRLPQLTNMRHDPSEKRPLVVVRLLGGKMSVTIVTTGTYRCRLCIYGRTQGNMELSQSHLLFRAIPMNRLLWGCEVWRGSYYKILLDNCLFTYLPTNHDISVIHFGGFERSVQWLCHFSYELFMYLSL